VLPAQDGAEELLRRADRAARKAPTERLGQRHDVGPDAERLDGTSPRDRPAGLHLVERQVRPVAMTEIEQPLEVARLRQDDAAVHHGGLDDHAGDAPLVLGERPLRLGQVVERHDAHEVRERLRDAHRLRHRHGVLTRPDQVRIRGHGEHQGIVVTVVGPLDLHDQVSAGVRPHQADRLEGGLRAGVAEPPQREAEPLGHVLADLVELRGGLREVRPQTGPLLDRLHHLRMGMPHDHRAVPEVVVDVLVAVEVPDVAPRSPIDEHRVRRRGLPGRRDAAGDVLPGHLPVLDRAAMLRLERRLLVGDQTVDQPEVELDRFPQGHPIHLSGVV
jgi:hypothetical protein